MMFADWYAIEEKASYTMFYFGFYHACIKKLFYK